MIERKRFILFAGLNYYPAGTDDIIGTYVEMDEALEGWEKRKTEFGDDWAEIFDIDTGFIVELKGPRSSTGLRAANF